MTKTEQFEARVAAIPDAELAEKCDRELSDLCKTGGDSFLMSIPPGVDDTDILFSELIRRFKNRDKWISVKDDLPPREWGSLSSFVWGYDPKWGLHKTYYKHSKSCWMAGNNITHWMPISTPEPPKEEDIP